MLELPGILAVVGGAALSFFVGYVAGLGRAYLRKLVSVA